MPQATRESEQLFFRDAQLEANAVVDADERTVRMSFSSERTVLRQPFFSAPFNEVLGHSAEEVNLERLQNGANLLFNHRGQGDTNDVLGVIEKAWVENGRGYCEARISRREQADGVWKDIQDGILRNVSVGYRIDKVRQTRGADEDTNTPAEVRVTRWTPMEVSIVSVPADASVGVGRASDGLPMTPELKEILTMPDRAEQAGDAPAPAANTVTLDDHNSAVERAAREAATAAVAAEAARRTDIERRFAPFAEQLRDANSTLLRECLDDINVEPGAAGERLLEVLAQRSADGPVGTGTVVLVEDARDKFRAAVTQVLDTRCNIERHDLQGNEFASCTLIELARESMRASNEPVAFDNKLGLVGRALTTSDFPILLTQTLRRSLLAGYEEAPETYPAIASIENLTDFRQVEMPQLSTYPNLEEIPEGGEYRYHEIKETAQAMKLVTWGSICAITRQAIINDDLRALATIPRRQGRAARRVLGDLVWSVLIDNPVMRDEDFARTGGTTPLFDAAHGNLAAAGAPVDADTLDAARVSMANQTGPGGQPLNVLPSLIIVPITQQTAVEQLMASTQDPRSAVPGVMNPVANFGSVLTDPRLHRADPDAWYVSAAPGQNDTIALGLLDGNDAPYTEEMDGWRVDGVELKVRIDATAAPLSWHGLYKNPGV